jgi:glyoxylase-like metal-dependent hydrolase (beta-lactamase superfamily II)
MRAVKNTNYLQLFPDVYQLNIGATNIILIVEEELTLIDTGLPGSASRIMKYIENLGRSVEEISLIIITHNHIDHAGGLAELRKLTGAQVAAHKDDLNDTENQAAYPGFVRRLLRIPSVSDLHSNFVLQPDDVDIQLEGGEVLKPLEGLEVIHTPGHTIGSISLYSPKYKLLVVGDAMTRKGKYPWLPHKSVSSDFQKAIKSIEKLGGLDINILCIGHRQPVTGDVNIKMQRLIKEIEFDNNRYK